MFLFDSLLFFEELKLYSPELFKASNVENGLNESSLSISVDYGIMEKSKRVAVVKLDSKWNDLGNFDALYNEFKKDECGNVALDCDKISINSSNNFITSRPKKIVSLIDVNNMIVVDTTDALLICPRSSCQKVKEVVKTLRNANDSRVYLHELVYKPWGSYSLLESSPSHKIKNITVMPGKKLSLQLHYHRNEHWAVVKGIAIVQVDEKEFFLRTGESTYIKEGMKHRLSNPGKIPLEIIEIQLGELVDENDIIRYDDEYGREDLNNKGS
jgi:mannose-1-phosphate guanylyltransferase / mannose-6-phosphate isomerase